MKISELSPEYTMIYKDRELTANNSGVPTNVYSLSFICPDCGSPYRVQIKVGSVEDRPNNVWGISPFPPFMGWLEKATMSASINNTNSGHGRKHPACSFHKTLVNGEFI